MAGSEVTMSPTKMQIVRDLAMSYVSDGIVRSRYSTLQLELRVAVLDGQNAHK